MFLWLLQIAALSILGIFLVHHSFLFLQNVFTTPKIKDLVDAPERKYKRIYETIHGGGGGGGGGVGNSASSTTLPSFQSIDIPSLYPEDTSAAYSTMSELLSGTEFQNPNNYGNLSSPFSPPPATAAATTTPSFTDSSAMKHELKSFLRQMMH